MARSTCSVNARIETPIRPNNEIIKILHKNKKILEEVYRYECTTLGSQQLEQMRRRLERSPSLTGPNQTPTAAKSESDSRLAQRCLRAIPCKTTVIGKVSAHAG